METGLADKLVDVILEIGIGMRPGEKIAVVTFFGDGATSEGDFHEALNFAGVFKTPNVFICQNNQYAISVPISRQTGAPTLAQKAIAYDLTARIHGTDEAERQVVVASAAFATEVDDPAVLAVLYDAVGGFEFGAEAEAWTAIDVAVAASGSSKGEARRLISQGGFRINGQQLTDPAAAPPALIGERYWWVAMGKKRRFVGRRAG